METSMRQRPDLAVLGGGGAGAMAILWTLAAGRSAVWVPGAGPPGDPLLGPGAMWCLPVGVHRHLALLDRLLLRRYGPGGLPTRADGSPWRLADALRWDTTRAGRAMELHEKWTDGGPRVTVTATWPAVLRVPAALLVAELWAYLAAVEAMDRRSGHPPRVRLRPADSADPGEPGGLREPGDRGKPGDTCEPGAPGEGADPGDTVGLGRPELVLLDDDPAGSTARACGIRTAPLVVDHGDGRGPTEARAHLIVGALDLRVGAQCRRRVAPAFDEDHDEYRVRQVVVGLGPAGAPAWLAVQVPEHHVFDPVEAGLVPPGAAPGSPGYLDAVRLLVRRLFVTAAAELLQRPEAVLDGAVRDGPDRPRLVSATAWRPAGPPSADPPPAGLSSADLFSAGVPADPPSAGRPLGGSGQGAGRIIAVGDAAGGGHPLHPLRAVAPFHHGNRVRRYWRRRAAGITAERAAAALTAEVAADTTAWIEASVADFAEPPQFHFNADCFAELAYARAHREHFAALEAGRAAPAHPTPMDGALR
ncbi:hypothetical protein [Actinoallomurus soli]|uniref:hypothetical protein n=1 Tax=Actinoallomurus soli TaxID=2952535 RepID=UPI002092992A|nr:hypothetical protein [Actinoallomurus soli]MCO5969055.1 hypothetical protein [Actinoallomurus soli]